jgi:threonyl-tRNA synthetase
MVNKVYADFGFNNILVKLSTRPENRVGDNATWDKSEEALATALDRKNIKWEELPGEGAFYGPKIEFSLQDAIGRIWQCGTIQVDFSMPEKLNATYIGEDGQKHTPVMLHRAILGSIERFIGILIEEHVGLLPLWLAPVQASILTISKENDEYAKNLQKKLIENNIRGILDIRNEKIGYKIREATIKRVQYQVVVGKKEMQTETVNVRKIDGSETSMTVEDFIVEMKKITSVPSI